MGIFRRRQLDTADSSLADSQVDDPALKALKFRRQAGRKELGAEQSLWEAVLHLLDPDELQWATSTGILDGNLARTVRYYLTDKRLIAVPTLSNGRFDVSGRHPDHSIWFANLLSFDPVYKTAGRPERVRCELSYSLSGSPFDLVTFVVDFDIDPEDESAFLAAATGAARLQGGLRHLPYDPTTLQAPGVAMPGFSTLRHVGGEGIATSTAAGPLYFDIPETRTSLEFEHESIAGVRAGDVPGQVLITFKPPCPLAAISVSATADAEAAWLALGQSAGGA
ncbi:hypothetical protein EDD99_8130 [Streptomyces sp. 846.5]|nr:hypothetical protein [Streptomyces sp. 846.5]TDT93321.1 hypothetical protein EDD99_8130 [Streptomyces sp. 846.5]